MTRWSTAFIIRGVGVEHDRNYGCDHRTGWTAVRDGRCLYPHLTSLWRALWALAVDVWRDRERRRTGDA